jgi:hypothetical protein
VAYAASPSRTETPGSKVLTWSDYRDAGGMPGPVLPAHKAVRVACRIEGFKAQDGNTWWYKVVVQGTRGTYYGSADAFYNNGRTSGSLRNTPFVDKAVALC